MICVIKIYAAELLTLITERNNFARGRYEHMTSKSDLKPIFISTLAKGLKPCDDLTPLN